MHGDVHQALELPREGDLGDARDRGRVEHAAADPPQRAQALGDQHAPVRQEREPPRVGQPGRDDGYADPLALGCVVDHRFLGQRHWGDAVRRERFRLRFGLPIAWFSFGLLNVLLPSGLLRGGLLRAGGHREQREHRGKQGDGRSFHGGPPVPR